MKHLRRYTALVCMFLVLCMLPAVAGAATLDKSELHFTVGEEGTQYVRALGSSVFFDSSNFINLEVPRLAAIGLSFDYDETVPEGVLFTFSGTPLTDGEYDFTIGTSSSEGGARYGLPLKIYIHKKQDAPVVDNVIYNAAPEHEQALIRGVREWCNVRAGAGTNSAVIGRANLGQQISLLRWNADESWCFVEFNGLQGWIAKQFILPIK